MLVDSVTLSTDFVLVIARFVDDLGDSDKDAETVKKIIEAADKLFESCGLQCKGWTVSGEDPHPDVTSDGVSVDIGGMVWYSKLDTLMIKIP